MTMNLEEAQAVVTAHREAERAARIEQNRRYVGRYFKFHNSCAHDERWWLYAAVTGVDPYAYLQGWSFQHTSSDTIEIERVRHFAGITAEHSEWIEITAAEFWSAATALRAIVDARLTSEASPPPALDV